jgi:predicted Zn finger-like uncharacterized protein
MVVTCPKCSTSYEFDETLIGPKGTVVRCTQCSHMFKIFADDSGDPIEHAGWMIRKLGGKVFGIDRFSTIQKWIREGKIDAEDSLSRTGKSWKKLGEIVELQGLFSSLGSTKAAVAPTPPPAGMDLPPRLSVQDGDPQEEPSGASPALAATTPAGSEPSGVARQKPEVRYDAPEPEVGTVKGPLARSLAPEVSAEEEKEDRLLMPDYRPGRWKRWLVLAIVLLVIGLGIGGYLKRDLLFGWYTGLTAPATEGEHDKALERAHEYFLLDTDSYFDQAEKIYRDLLAKDDHDTGARVGLAELLSVRAQYARDKREILGLTEGVEDAGTLAREARKVAQLAVLASPDSLEANRALADALRLSGDLEGARKHLDKALDIDPRNPETLYVATLIDLDEGRELDRVIKDLERILGRAEALIRVRYRLALLHALAGDKESSRSEAEKILEMNTDHDLASSLVKLLEQGAIRPLEELEPEPEPEQVEEAVAEAGVEQPEEPEVPPQETEGKKVAGEPAGTSSGVPMGKSYDYYIGKAVKYRSDGDCDRALDYFEKALQIRPSSVEALSGSAYCHMGMYQYGPAMAEFKRALKSNKNYGPALIGLAQAMEKKGNIKGAVEYYKKYLDSHSSGAQAGLARNKVKELEDTIGPGDKPALDESGEGGEDTSAPEVPKKVEEEVEIKGSVGQPSGDTPTTAGDPYD